MPEEKWDDLLAKHCSSQYFTNNLLVNILYRILAKKNNANARNIFLMKYSGHAKLYWLHNIRIYLNYFYVPIFLK